MINYKLLVLTIFRSPVIVDMISRGSFDYTVENGLSPGFFGDKFIRNRKRRAMCFN